MGAAGQTCGGGRRLLGHGQPPPPRPDLGAKPADIGPEKDGCVPDPHGRRSGVVGNPEVRRRRARGEVHRQRQRKPKPAERSPPQADEENPQEGDRKSPGRGARNHLLGPGQAGEGPGDGVEGVDPQPGGFEGQVAQAQGRQDHAESQGGHEQQGRDRLRNQVCRQAVKGHAVEMLEGEGTGGQARRQGDQEACDQGCPGALQKPDRQRRRDLADRGRPGLRQGDEGGRGGEGHLEPGLGHGLRSQNEEEARRQGQGAQADGAAVSQYGCKGRAGGHPRPDRRIRRPGKDEIAQDGDHAADSGDLAPGKAQGEARNPGDREAKEAIDEAADDSHVQAGDRDDMGQSRRPQRLLLSGGDEGLMARGHGSGEAAPVRSHPLDKPPGQVPTEGVDAHLKDQAPWKSGLRRRKRPDLAEGQADSSNAVEEGVAGEVVGTGGGRWRRRIEQGGDGDPCPGRRGRALAPESQPDPDRGLPGG